MAKTKSTTGQNVGYVRVSTTDQNTARQLEGVEVDHLFEDKASGASTARPQLQACLTYVREGDTLHVHSIDRLARSLGDLETLINGLLNRGIAVRFHKENLTFGDGNSSAIDRLLLQMLGAVAQFERSLINERAAEGRAAARKRGVRFGRPPGLTKEQIKEIRQRKRNGESAVALAKEYGIGRSSIYRAVS